jgi:hypothetical protein
MIKIVIIICGIIIVKIIINAYRYFEINHYYKCYQEWFSDNNLNLVQKKESVIHLWKMAGIQDSFVPRMENAGYGKLMTYNKHIFFSFPSNEEDLVNATILAFNQAIGIYRRRIYNSINPIEWILGVIFLPQHLLQYLGLKVENVFVKICQVIWWLVATISGFFVALYPEKLKKIIDTVLTIK